jgi:hypothetical protein
MPSFTLAPGEQIEFSLLGIVFPSCYRFTPFPGSQRQRPVENKPNAKRLIGGVA